MNFGGAKNRPNWLITDDGNKYPLRVETMEVTTADSKVIPAPVGCLVINYEWKANKLLIERGMSRGIAHVKATKLAEVCSIGFLGVAEVLGALGREL